MDQRVLRGLGDASETDVTYDDGTGDTTTYYDDGSNITYDTDGNIVDQYSPPGVTPIESTPVAAPSTFFGPDGSYDTSTNDFPSWLSQEQAAGSMPNSISLPPGVTSATAQKIIQGLGTDFGTWIARTVGGQTILTRSGTFNIQSLLIPGALILGLILFSSKGGD